MGLNNSFKPLVTVLSSAVVELSIAIKESRGSDTSLCWIFSLIFLTFMEVKQNHTALKLDD